MKRRHALGLAMVAGMAIGALAVEALHAQGAKLKAYSIGEIIPIAGATISANYLDAARKAISDSHGRSLRTVNGKVFYVEGEPAPTKVAIVEWDSADDARAFYSSKAWTDLASERDKTELVTRRYLVEVEP